MRAQSASIVSHGSAMPAARSTRSSDRKGDAEVVGEMRQLRAVVKLARFVRQQAGVKHRQPLRVARVGGLSDELLAVHRALLAAELSVKTVERHEAKVSRELVLDYGKLGKRLRGAMKAVAAAVAAGAYVERPDGSLEVAGERLDASEVTWRAALSSAHVDLAVTVSSSLSISRSMPSWCARRPCASSRAPSRICASGQDCATARRCSCPSSETPWSTSPRCASHAAWSRCRAWRWSSR